MFELRVYDCKHITFLRYALKIHYLFIKKPGKLDSMSSAIQTVLHHRSTTTWGINSRFSGTMGCFLLRDTGFIPNTTLVTLKGRTRNQ